MVTETKILNINVNLKNSGIPENLVKVIPPCEGLTTGLYIVGGNLTNGVITYLQRWCEQRAGWRVSLEHGKGELNYPDECFSASSRHGTDTVLPRGLCTGVAVTTREASLLPK